MQDADRKLISDHTEVYSDHGVASQRYNLSNNPAKVGLLYFKLN